MLLLLVLLAADAGASTLYSGATREPHGLVQLELRGKGQALFRRVISVHLPPTELESLEVKVTEKGGALCLQPAPRSIEPCLERTGEALEATLKDRGVKVRLEKR